MVVPWLLFFASPLALVAANREVRWSDLDRAFGGKTIEISTSSAVVTGKFERVDGSALIVKEKGDTSARVERADIRRLHMRRGGWLWRGVFLTWGSLTTMGAVLQGGAGTIAATGVFGAGVFLLGNYLDTRKVEVSIID